MRSHRPENQTSSQVRTRDLTGTSVLREGGAGSGRAVLVKHPHAAAEQEDDQDVRSIPHMDRADAEGQSAKGNDETLSALGHLE